MNPASRVHNFLKDLKKHYAKNEKLLDVYKKVFKTDDLFRVFEILHLIQQNLKVVEREILNTNKQDDFKQFITLAKLFILPTNLEIYIANNKTHLDTIEPIFMVLSHSFENRKYAENDISDDVTKLQEQLIDFVSALMKEDAQKSDKQRLLYVIHTINKALDNYKYLGVSALHESMIMFECIVKDEKSAEPFFKKLKSFLDKAKNIDADVAFLSNKGEDIYDIMLLLGN